MPKSGLQMGKMAAGDPTRIPCFPPSHAPPPPRIASIPGWLDQSRDFYCRPKHMVTMWPPFVAQIVKLMTCCLQRGGCDGGPDKIYTAIYTGPIPRVPRVGTLLKIFLILTFPFSYAWYTGIGSKIGKNRPKSAKIGFFA